MSIGIAQRADSCTSRYLHLSPVEYKRSVGVGAFDTLIIANLRAEDTGAYSVTVTGSGGSVSTRVAKLVVLLPPILASPARLSDGSFQFTFTNSPGAIFKALATTNLALPLSNWTVVDGVTEISPGQFQFRDPQAPSNPQQFYHVRWP